MKHAHSLPRRRNAFTLIELLVVMVLILVIAAVGLGYIVFGQDNQHSVNGAQAVTGALLNAKQRARRDGLPTGRAHHVRPHGPGAERPGDASDPTSTHPAAGRLQRRAEHHEHQRKQRLVPWRSPAWISRAAPQTLATSTNRRCRPGDYFLLPAIPAPHRITRSTRHHATI